MTMDSEQLGHIQDTLIDQGISIKTLQRGHDEMAKDIVRLDRVFTTVNESVIRLDEQVKGIREQNINHHKQQLENDKALGDTMTVMATSMTTLLSAMGLDPKNDSSIQEMRKDFFAIRETRMNKKTHRDHFIRALITVGTTTVVGVILSLLYLGVQTQLRKDLNDEHGVTQNGPQTTVPQLRNR